jgi:hypothetical protein
MSLMQPFYPIALILGTHMVKLLPRYLQQDLIVALNPYSGSPVFHKEKSVNELKCPCAGVLSPIKVP